MLAGILVDLSSVMGSALQLDVQLEEQAITRIQSIFNAITTMLQHAGVFRETDELFVLAFGLQEINTCDLLSLIEDGRRLDRQYKTTGHECLTQLMAQNGASYLAPYINKYLSQQAAGALFETFSQNRSLLMNFIAKQHMIGVNATECATHSTSKSAFFTFLNLFSSVFSGNTPTAAASEDNGNYEERRAKKCIEEAVQCSTIIKLKTMLTPRKWSLDKFASLLVDVVEWSNSLLSAKEHLSNAHLFDLVNPIKPYIHGDAQVCEALGYALETFQSTNHTSKVLFILSDGESKDGDSVKLAEQLHSSGVTVFACLLSSENICHPRRLYYEPDPSWPKAHRDMFELSSTIENSHSTMSILLEQGWELPLSGHSRLFIQANHPDVIKEFSDVIQYMSKSQEVLLNTVGRVSLDIYINARNSSFAPKQQEAICSFVYAVATVFHLAMCRIEGRENGVPAFEDMCQDLINEFGDKGAQTRTVLEKCAHRYRLKYKEVDELGARQAINERRPVVATFRLSKKQWDAFNSFYKNNAHGVLERKDLGSVSPEARLFGHAVVLMKCDPTSLTFINSWGTDFADYGFFRVRNQLVLGLRFYDVYWDLDDLMASEIEAFKKKCIEKGQNLIQELPPGIQNLPYKCPQCYESSPVRVFIIHISDAECPKCRQHFKPTLMGLDVTTYAR